MRGSIAGKLHYLDLCLSLMADHLCWCYSSRSVTSLLLYGSPSCHSKLIKNSRLRGCLWSALKTSLYHLILERGGPVAANYEGLLAGSFHECSHVELVERKVFTRNSKGGLSVLQWFPIPMA